MTLLTCAPGEELYSTFGHTALRVQDSSRGTVEVFNYGTFEFGPDFYSQFIRGKLRYFLSVQPFFEFLEEYRYQSRSVVEQEIQLGCSEKQQLLRALYANAQGENRFYRYDFLFDNCTTRAGNMVVQNAGAPVAFRNILPSEVPSFRDLIHTYLDAGHQPWSKLGIDLLLGSDLDLKVSNREAMFLPDYLLKGFDSASIGGRPLVTSPQKVLDVPSPLTAAPLITPTVAFFLLFLVIGALSFLQRKGIRRFLFFFDVLFFFLLGAVGLLLLFMWFGTDHIVCRNNFNLFWALPTHLVMAFFLLRPTAWVRFYYGMVCGLSLVLLAAWAFLPQELNPALLPLVALIALRGWRRAQEINDGNKDHSDRR